MGNNTHTPACAKHHTVCGLNISFGCYVDVNVAQACDDSSILNLPDFNSQCKPVAGASQREYMRRHFPA